MEETDEIRHVVGTLTNLKEPVEAYTKWTDSLSVSKDAEYNQVTKRTFRRMMEMVPDLGICCPF